MQFNKSRLGSLIILLLTITSLQAFGDDPEPEKVILPQYDCPYKDMSQDVVSLSDRTINLLTEIKEKGKNCGSISNSADMVKNELEQFFYEQRNQLGISSEWREWGSTEVTCSNYQAVYELEYSNALSSVKNGIPIDSTNFFSKCPVSANESETINCLQDGLATRLYNQHNACKSGGGKSLVQQQREYRASVARQQMLAGNIRNSMNQMYSNLLDPECKSMEGIRKAMINGIASIGATVANTTLGPGSGVAITLAGEGINFVLDYMTMLEKEGTTLDDLIKNKELESHLCLFLEVQKKDCAKYDHDLKVDCIDCKKLPDESIIPDGTKNIFDNWKKLLNNKDLEGAAAGVMLREIVLKSATDNNISFPGDNSKPKSYRKLLDNAIIHYKKTPAKNPQELASLQEAAYKFDNGFLLLKEYARLQNQFRRSVKSKNIKTLDQLREYKNQRKELLAEMTENIKDLSSISLPSLLEGYYNEKVLLKDDKFDKLEAREFAAKMTMRNLKTPETLEGDNLQLAKLTSAMIDTFKPSLGSFAKKRYSVGMKAALESEISDRTIPKNTEKIKAARRSTFRYLRDSIKDCIALPGLSYMKHRSRGKVTNFFLGEQLLAPLNINPSPKTYHRTCMPYMCGEKDNGIPVPNLTNIAKRPDDFGRYQCKMINSYNTIYKNMEDEYIKTGKICGKSLVEITKGGRNFTAWKNRSAAKEIGKKIGGGKSTGHMQSLRDWIESRKQKKSLYDEEMIKKIKITDPQTNPTSSDSSTAKNQTPPVGITLKVNDSSNSSTQNTNTKK